MGKNKTESKLIKLGSDPDIHFGSLSDPIYKTSTIIFKNYDSFLFAKKFDEILAAYLNFNSFIP